MKRLLALLALLSLALALPAVAPAKKKHKHASHHRTTVLKGSFRAVGADGAYTDRKFGKAQLVDNRKRDKLSVHLRRLAPRTTYTFALYSVAKGVPRCEGGASGGTQVTAFPPKAKKTNKRGNLNATKRSRTFRADRAKRYFVLVSRRHAAGRLREAQRQEGQAGLQARPEASGWQAARRASREEAASGASGASRRRPRSPASPRARTQPSAAASAGGRGARQGAGRSRIGRPVLAAGYPSRPMYTVLSVVQVFIAVGLIFLILLHSGKDAGMSGAFGVGTGGGSAGGSLMERNLDRWTIIFAILFVAEHVRAAQDLALLTSAGRQRGRIANRRAWTGPCGSRCSRAPTPTNPLAGGDPCVKLGGGVVAPFGPSNTTSLTCIVKPGTKVFVVAQSYECSTVEGPPFFGGDEVELRRCARAADAGFTRIGVTLDGRPVHVSEVETPAAAHRSARGRHHRHDGDRDQLGGAWVGRASAPVDPRHAHNRPARRRDRRVRQPRRSRQHDDDHRQASAVGTVSPPARRRPRSRAGPSPPGGPRPRRGRRRRGRSARRPRPRSAPRRRATAGPPGSGRRSRAGA